MLLQLLEKVTGRRIVYFLILHRQYRIRQKIKLIMFFNLNRMILKKKNDSSYSALIRLMLLCWGGCTFLLNLDNITTNTCSCITIVYNFHVMIK